MTYKLKAYTFFWKILVCMPLEIFIKKIIKEVGVLMYIRNLENSRLKPVFSVHKIHLYLCWQLENTKCALFKISDVQIYIYLHLHRNAMTWLCMSEVTDCVSNSNA